MTQIKNIRKNCMGTTDFEMQIQGMRKPQEFIVYPMQKDSASTEISIQSDNRFGVIDLTTGKGKMSKPHGTHAGFFEFALDKARDLLTDFELTQLDLQTLKMFIFTTQGAKVGNNPLHVYCDNSKAAEVLNY